MHSVINIATFQELNHLFFSKVGHRLLVQPLSLIQGTFMSFPPFMVFGAQLNKEYMKLFSFPLTGVSEIDKFNVGSVILIACLFVQNLRFQRNSFNAEIAMSTGRNVK